MVAVWTLSYERHCDGGIFTRAGSSSPDDFPCSTLIEVKRVGSPKASPPLKVEINATGVIGAGGWSAPFWGVEQACHRAPGPNSLGSASGNQLPERYHLMSDIAGEFNRSPQHIG